MLKFIVLLTILFLPKLSNAQVISLDIDTDFPQSKFTTGKDVIDFMYQKHKQGPCKTYTFSQKNTHYRNDSVIGNSEWHEYIEFPDKFRIDFGKTEDGNFVIFKNDSAYRYKNNQLKKVSENSNILLLLLGGMYYRDLSDIINRLEKEHYNTKIVSEQKWNKQQMFVIGAIKGDSLSNQIWVEKKNWRVVRIIERMDAENIMDMTFDAFQKNCKGYIETKVTFKRNGKIEQVEEYYNITPTDKMPTEIFNPK
ncbi:MAG: hypothetical protein KAZ71_03570 [Bacteroidia bacterium]|nr:hypothetical protein [Bacteroidia bacterium]